MMFKALDESPWTHIELTDFAAKPAPLRIRRGFHARVRARGGEQVPDAL